MSFEISLLAVVLAGALAVFVLFPLFERQADTAAPHTSLHGTRQQNQALETLWAEKTRVLRAIRDLDFDYDLNKLTNEPYIDQRVYLVRLAIVITRRLDELEADITVQQNRVDAAVSDFRQA